jgi:hypothetical protein
VGEDRPFLASADQALVVHLKRRAKKPRGPRQVDSGGGEQLDEQQVKTLERLIKKLGDETSQF